MPKDIFSSCETFQIEFALDLPILVNSNKKFAWSVSFSMREG